MAFPYVDHTWAAGHVLSIARMNNLESQFQSIIDLLTTRGDISYRGAATWERLAKGNEGDYLRQGANDPAWASIVDNQVIRKTADQIVNNSVVLVNDTHLLLPVAANEIWLIHMILRMVAANATPDLDYAFAVPAGGVIEGMEIWDYNTSSPLEDLTAENTTNVETAVRYLQIYILYVGGGNAGNVQLQWAQNVATAVDTTMKINSLMLCHRIV